MADRAFLGVFGNRVVADDAGAIAVMLRRLARQADGLLRLELRQQAQRRRVAGQREAPDAQARAVVVQFHDRRAGMVGQRQGQLGTVRPGLPAAVVGLARQRRLSVAATRPGWNFSRWSRSISTQASRVSPSVSSARISSRQRAGKASARPECRFGFSLVRIPGPRHCPRHCHARWQLFSAKGRKRVLSLQQIEFPPLKASYSISRFF